MKLLWVTGFKDLGRDKWNCPRPFEMYFEYFDRIKGLDLVCFADEPWASIIKERTGLARVLPWNESDTFWSKYIDKQREIIEDPVFQASTPMPDALWPGTTRPEYGLVCATKTCLVRRASELFPEYTHFGWIDFGWAKEQSVAPPPRYVCDRLVCEDKIMIGSARDLFFDADGEPMYGAFASTDRSQASRYNWNNPRLVLREMHWRIHGNLYVVPKHLTHWLEKKMEWAIQRHHVNRIADQDEPYMLTIVHDFPSKFHVHVKSGHLEGGLSWVTGSLHGSFTVEKSNGQLHFVDYGCDGVRNKSMFWCIQQADAVYNWSDFGPIRIFTNDHEPDANTWTVAKYNSFSKLVPDWNFCRWDAIPQVSQDYDEFVQQISEAGLRPPQIPTKAGWIGKASHGWRERLVQIAQENPDLLECELMDWGADWFTPSKFVSTPELVAKYGYLIDIEGYGYSGRLKHLLWSRRPVLLVDRPAKEYFHEHLVPWTHYVPVRRDLTDLVEKVQWLRDHPAEAQAIGQRAYEFSQTHLTRAACYRRWNEVIQGPSQITWVTAFRDLGRDKWKSTTRSIDSYIESFERIRHLDPVCFVDEPIASLIRERTGHKRIFPWNEADTFIDRHVSRQREILQDPEFQRRVPELLKWAPEFSNEMYGLVNCAKACFLRRASEMLPGSTHFGWIDFGFAKKPEETPPQMARPVVSDKIIISSFRTIGFDAEGEPALGTWGIPDAETNIRFNWNNPVRCLTEPPQIIHGNVFIVPRDLTHWLEREMERALMRYHERRVVRNDEILFLSILHDFRSKFHVVIRTGFNLHGFLTPDKQ